MGILQELDDGVLHLSLARPDKRNALNLETLTMLSTALENLDPSVRVVVLQAQGDVFCAGGDVQAMVESAGDAQAVLSRLRGGVNRVVQAMAACPRPIVAKVQGDAVGAGIGLAIAADMTLMDEKANLVFSFRNVGLGPDTGVSLRLPGAVGLQRAKALLWLGGRLTASQAVTAGLAYEAVPSGRLDRRADELVGQLTDAPGPAVAAAKRGLQLHPFLPLRDALESEALLQAQVALTWEHREGRDAFLAKRRPDFRIPKRDDQ